MHVVSGAVLEKWNLLNPRQFDGRTTFAIWLTRIAVNAATRTLLTETTDGRAASSSRAGTAVT